MGLFVQTGLPFQNQVSLMSQKGRPPKEWPLVPAQTTEAPNLVHKVTLASILDVREGAEKTTLDFILTVTGRKKIQHIHLNS